MRGFRLVPLLLVVLTQPVGAATTIEVYPPAPQPADFLTIRVTYPSACFRAAEADVDGDRITATAVESCTCAAPPVPLAFQVVVDAQPVGVYRVIAARERRDAAASACTDPEVLAARPLAVSRDGDVAELRIEPPLPTDAAPVAVVLGTPCPMHFDGPHLAPGHVGIDLVDGVPFGAPCATFPAYFSRFELGLLPAGTYELVIGALGGGVDVRTSFEVRAETASEPTLLAGRFRVSAHWRTAAGEEGSGHAVRLSDNTEAFWFFSAPNLEVFVKVLDGCATNGSVWVFAAGLTDVETTLTVEDLETAESKTYPGSAGTAFPPVVDTDAFACF